MIAERAERLRVLLDAFRGMPNLAPEEAIADLSLEDLLILQSEGSSRRGAPQCLP